MMPGAIFNKRLALLKDELRKRDLDSFLVTKDINVSYLSGFTGHDAVMIVTTGKSFFIADSRYIEEANDSVRGLEVRLVKTSLYEMIEDISSSRKLKRLGFESASLPYEVVIRLKGLVPKNALVPVKGLLEELRSIKDAGEIELIRRSIRLTRDVFDKIRKFIKPGVSEESVARRIEAFFIMAGAGTDFDPIVAADANSSKPHATPSGRKISNNGFVMIDIGCSLKGYNSDMTRIIAMGKMPPKIKKIYDIVCAAQAMAIEAVRPGAEIARIDAAARGYIRDKGFGKYFGHALGHGVGMEVHEKPSVSSVSDGVVRPGMVFTVEPAIYIPKVGGIRIEDMVLVTDKGCEILSN